ncbi:hypothetical protein ACHAXT_003472 [Thalassiosira profunda]
MVLAEVPLWASHGATAEDNGAKTLPGMEGANQPAQPTLATQQSKDKAAAKAALSLLASTRAGGAHAGAARRAPIYSVDVHPDGTRFATAAGDGTVKIWSTGCLFNGRLLKDAKKKEGRGASSRFTEGGNYVSSTAEDEESSSSEDGGGKKRQPAAATQQKQQSGVNDLSGLVRKKKGGSPAAAANPFAVAAAAPSNSEGPMPPLSRLTQRPAGANVNASANPSDPNTNATKPHKLLCTLASSEGSVLSLRFSPSGTYLAAAGDDSYVTLYARSDAPSPAKGNLTSGNSATEDIEHWNRIAICRGHHLDVVGLAWAPDDSHLVSCSLDSAHPVIVWKLYDALGSGEGSDGMAGRIHNLHPHKVLGKDVHTSTVKGVAFDPAGRFIATSGDDPAICIWRASDDWGLEARIDSSSGVFKSKKRRAKGGDEGAEEEDDPGELAGLSLFRRISFAPDGSHVCGTNATLRGKNVAAMISREGWAASGPRDKNGGDAGKPPPGAANLVGHKQPVVASRHCPVFFRAPRGGEDSDDDGSGSEDDPDAEPEYATLVALGDKRGFVTVWSTKSSRPLFKMQCSESRCTVTDLSWGVVRSKKGAGDSLVLIVSLLDGYVVALHFDVPAEAGGGDILSGEKARRIFQRRYGIEDFAGSYGRSPGRRRRPKRLVDDAGPMLIENALQLTMEMEAEGQDEEMDVAGGVGGDGQAKAPPRAGGASSTTGNIRDKQVETTKSGKKRIRPVLLSVDGGGAVTNNVSDEERDGGKKRRKENQSLDPLQNALDAASQAASVAEGVAAQASNRVGNAGSKSASQSAARSTAAVSAESASTSLGPAIRIPYSTNRVHSIDLATGTTDVSASPSILDEGSYKIVADCTNSMATPSGGGAAWPSATLTISRGGVRQWKDIIAKAKCTALNANEQLLALGTADGCLYLYGMSSTMGWESGKAYRAFPPFVLGSPVVEISVGAPTPGASDQYSSCEMVVVTSDGSFYVYTILPAGPKLNYKGTVVPAMQHLHLTSTASSSQRTSSSSPQPKLARIQVTDSKQLMLILVLPTKSSGRILQGFVYNRKMELWMRVSDSSNFLLSDFYSSLPAAPKEGSQGLLAKMDGMVKSAGSTASAKQMYLKIADNASASEKIVTRSHCEDRLACAIALGSAPEFQTWARNYAQCLSSTGDAAALRFLVDLFLGAGQPGEESMHEDGSGQQHIPSFLSAGLACLGLEGKDVIRKAILPEMGKSRTLQRLTNEIATELECL